MNLKQIQAVEFIISRMNHDKRLVVEYKGKLLSADFLAYFNPYGENIYAHADENKDFLPLEEVSSYDFYANNALYSFTYKDNFSDDKFVHLGENKYKLTENGNITPQTLKDVVQHVMEYDKNPENLERKIANVTPRNVEFFDTNKTLPFYLFPEDAEFIPKALVERKLTFD